MTAWGACSLVQIVSTIQSSQTAETAVDQKEAVSAGISTPIFNVPGLCRHQRSLRLVLGLRSLHPKIPFPATEFRDRTDQTALGNRLLRRGSSSFGNLLRIQSEGFELSAPFRGSVAEPFDTDAARQTTFDRGFDEVRCEERERDGHVDLSHAAFLACGDLLDVNGRA
jgi:hypothetical protein